MVRNTTLARRLVAGLATVGTLAAMAVVGLPAANAYAPEGSVIWTPTQTDLNNRNKGGEGNTAVYPKSAQLDNGRIVMSFEKSVGDPVGETLPIYASDDYGTSWKHLTDLQSPAAMTKGTDREAAYAKYVSNWTNPYLYTLPQDIGSLKKGTLLLASVVSGDDAFYKEQKAKDPNWIPSADGDRKDMAIALYASADGNGEQWRFLDIIATGGWSGSYGNHSRQSTENTYHQNDPVWEPYLMVYKNQLVCYYSDENEYLSVDQSNGHLTPDPSNDTATDPISQILVHKTWDGSSTSWSEPVLDVADIINGKNSKGRPGMTNVVPTTDGKWLLTYEQGGARISDDPLRFWDKPRVSLAGTDGNTNIHKAGSPVVIALPDGRLAMNDDGSMGGDLYINQSGRSDGEWTRLHTNSIQSYSRALQYVPQTGRLLVLTSNGGRDKTAMNSQIKSTDMDPGRSVGAYYRFIAKDGHVLGTGGKTQDASLTGDTPDVRTEPLDESADTQWWHMQDKGDGAFTFLNKSAGRSFAPWGQGASAGQRLGSWVDEGTAKYEWKTVPAADGYVRLQNQANPDLVLGVGADGWAELQKLDESADGQLWKIRSDDVTAPVISGVDDVTIHAGDTFDPMAGVAARDAVDGEVKVTVSGAVDANKPGTYKLTYTAVDRSGNKATVTRTVTVLAAEAPAGPGEPGTPGESTNVGNTGTAGTAGANNGQNANAQNPSASTDKPKPTLSNTGAAVMGLGAVAVVMAAAGALFLRRRKA